MRKNIVGLGEVAIIEAQLVAKDGQQVYLVELGGEQVILEECEGKTFHAHSPW